MILLYNPRKGSPIKDRFNFQPFIFDVNTLQKVDEILSEYLLDKYHYLQKISPSDVIRIQREMSKPEPVTKEEVQQAEYENLTDKQKEVMNSIPDLVLGKPVRRESRRTLTPEESAGIPTSGKDRDGVEWVGPGLEDDTPATTIGMELRSPGISKGVFGAN
jgi:hypothetical protein